MLSKKVIMLNLPQQERAYTEFINRSDIDVVDKKIFPYPLEGECLVNITYTENNDPSRNPKPYREKARVLIFPSGEWILNQIYENELCDVINVQYFQNPKETAVVVYVEYLDYTQE